MTQLGFIGDIWLNCIKMIVVPMAPCIVLKDGKPVLTVGTPGGPRIISAIANVLVNILDFGMDMQPAIEAGRFHNPNNPATDIEKVFSEDVMRAMPLMPKIRSLWVRAFYLERMM